MQPSERTRQSADDRLPAVDVVPDNEAVEVSASSEENSAFGRFSHAVSEADVFVRLIPRRQQEDIDDDSLTLTEQRFAHRCRFRQRVGRVQQIQVRTVEVRGR